MNNEYLVKNLVWNDLMALLLCSNSVMQSRDSFADSGTCIYRYMYLHAIALVKLYSKQEKTKSVLKNIKVSSR